MKNLSLVLVSLLIGFNALAKPPHGLCRLSYHSDSAGRGIEAGFKGLNLRPSPLDESCYLQGVDEGAALPKGDQICNREFENGKQNGLNVSPYTTGTECFNKGYISGFALLGAAARAGETAIVGGVCVTQYKQGFKDGKQSGTAANQPNIQPEMSCYLTGFYDSAELGALP